MKLTSAQFDALMNLKRSGDTLTTNGSTLASLEKRGLIGWNQYGQREITDKGKIALWDNRKSSEVSR
jgi:repressor of nif and glnA expression